MEVLCQNCGFAFDSPLEDIGRIEYTKSPNVFRMEYGVKIPCPSCKQVLKVLPDQSLFVGIPMTTFSKSSKDFDQAQEDKTIQQEQKIVTFSVKLDEDKTIVRTDQSQPLIQAAKSQKKFSYQSLQKLSLTASCVLFGLSVFFIFKNEKTISSVEKKVDIVSKYYEEEYTEEMEQELAYYEQEQAYQDALEQGDDSIGGLKDEASMRLEMTEEQLLNVKKTKSDLQILYLPSLRKVTSSYGVRLDPFTKKLAFHGGIDFKAKQGSNVHAALDGTVEFSGRKGLYGNVVILKHKKGYKTLYAHLQKNLVKKGQKVSRKDIIGLAGSTGRSTGPHLHFELHHKGKKKDPLQADLIPKG